MRIFTKNVNTDDTTQADAGTAETAPTTAADSGTADKGTDTGTVETPTSDAPTGATGTGGIDAIITAAQSGDSEALATALDATTTAVEAVGNNGGLVTPHVEPVEPVDPGPKPLKRRGDSKKVHAARLAEWQAKRDAYTASRDAAEQGATPDKPADLPVVPEAATPEVPATVKPDLSNVGGYDLTRWPHWLPVRPSLEAILAARSFGLHNAHTKHELGIACSIEQANPAYDDADHTFNVYDYGWALNTVPEVNRGGTAKPDQKMNSTNGAAKGGWVNVIKTSCPDKMPGSTLSGGKSRVVYRATLTDKGTKKAGEYLSSHGLKMPHWLSDPAAVRAEHKAQSNVPSARDSGPVIDIQVNHLLQK